MRIVRTALLSVGTLVLATVSVASTVGPEATAVTAKPALVVGPGPAGGFTPNDLAVAYRYNQATARRGQLVAVVSWYRDPSIRANLVKFDHKYGIPTETSSSFRTVNQQGRKTPLPSSSKGKTNAGQTATAVETVRGTCHTCRILLVEAKSETAASVAVAERTAGRLGASEITNLLAIPEVKEPASVLAAFNQPGVVITAPAGDQGWYGMNYGFNASGSGRAVSVDAPMFPASLPTVVAVGATTLEVNKNITRANELVWNGDGIDGQAATVAGAARGATGGGCSRRYPAAKWQLHNPGYPATACKGTRLVTDVSAAGDAASGGGIDVYDSWGHSGWFTSGGTDQSAALIAGLYALAGGSGGSAYPAASIYENAKQRPTSLYDVVNNAVVNQVGGNGFCAGSSTSDCGADAFTISSGGNHNPNALGAGNVDCSFPRNGHDPVEPPPISDECNAAIGYDGPSGVGAPNSDALFKPTNPSVSAHHSSPVKARKKTTLTLKVHARIAGTHVTKVAVNWGDGHTSTGKSLKLTHTYKRPGSRTIVVLVTDSLGQQTIDRVRVTVTRAAGR